MNRLTQHCNYKSQPHRPYSVAVVLPRTTHRRVFTVSSVKSQLDSRKTPSTTPKMPKGKAKKDNPDLYQGSPEPSEPSMAPEAVSHRRGGTHKVRDEDKTNSIYDNYNYKELLDAAKDRGIYRKDMKKMEMAWALKRHDEEKKKAEHDAMVAHQRKMQEAKREQEKKAAEKQKMIDAKRKRRVEKMRMRDRDESVSDDTMSDTEIEAEENTRDEYQGENIGQVLSDESWDSTCTESSIRSIDPPISPDCKLRLFEWPYECMPPLHAIPPCIIVEGSLPRQVPYAPIKLITTHTRQKICLPGTKYPPAVSPFFVPILNHATRIAARNGHLTGILRHATLERGTEWAERTHVQGWNACLYFAPAARNPTKQLADSYRKWEFEDRKLLSVSGEARERRHGQREKNKRMKMVDVYESCKWRPQAMGYVPAYLDYGMKETDEGSRTLENLFYIRFPDCDVPHYYFWANKGERDRVEDMDRREVDCGQELGVKGKYPRKSWNPPTTESCQGGFNGEEGEMGGQLEEEEEALYRRSSVGVGKVQEWLNGVSPMPTILPESEDEVDNVVREEKEDMCPFCCMHWVAMTLRERAEHMLSHSTTESSTRRRTSTPFRVPTQRSRVHSPRLSTDTGVDADINTPRKPTFLLNPPAALRLKTLSRKAAFTRRSLDKTYMAGSPSSPSHTPSSYLPTPKYSYNPPDHLNALYDPRKRSASSMDSQDVLETYRVRERRSVETSGNRGPGEAVGLFTLERRKSEQLDPSYTPTSTKTARKRRRITDPTYRYVAHSSDDEEELESLIAEKDRYCDMLPSPVLSDRKLEPLRSRKTKAGCNGMRENEVPAAVKKKKRRNIVDPTYRAGTRSPESSASEIMASISPVLADKVLRPLKSHKRNMETRDAIRALKKRRKITDTTYRDTETATVVSPNSSEVELPARKKWTLETRKVVKIVRFNDEPVVIQSKVEDTDEEAVSLDEKSDGLSESESQETKMGRPWCAVM
ncbi:hypothetical protein BDW02DRAFT_76351 [Decorospora gaudefroyi]|uniref:Uncharacterized protein n=1 Tax=Decorospora gaudefroyi TaxID=184978 RepID=A0A6A5K0W0_9PLEO|nr:hypothetical protein BDW02DRAFT_76351 [Decorospora gaudefroyi]